MRFAPVPGMSFRYPIILTETYSSNRISAFGRHLHWIRIWDGGSSRGMSMMVDLWADAGRPRPILSMSDGRGLSLCLDAESQHINTDVDHT